MKSPFRNNFAWALLLLLSSLLFCGMHRGLDPRQDSANVIKIDYPLEGSVFPPEITPPLLMWRDPSAAKRWMIEFQFEDGTKSITVGAEGEPWKPGEIDPKAGAGEEVTKLSPELAATRTWRPSAELWKSIQQHSVKRSVVVLLRGFADADNAPVSQGQVSWTTSSDPVGAPIFYRDVPLMLSPHTEKGAIQPLPPFAIPLIKWRLRDIGNSQSKVVMENLPTCANCHSFSADGKTLGLDVDGPKNDKGLYALVPITQHAAIRNQDVIRWSSMQADTTLATSEPAVKRFGFMSQVSPNGRYVITSVGPPHVANTHDDKNPDFAPGLSDRLFSTTYMHVDFTQVFYPTRGILVWYDREEAKLRPLPGADDPQYVQTSAFWSPDGEYLIYSRAKAVDPYPEGAKKPESANDPNEPQVQYDLYKILFNDGKGGTPEPVLGASRNGMSNNFPKVSPDGRWIVFVQNKTGLLMRPDSKLYIVPFAGGKARLMRCNTRLMNSWHSFSPNGRWLAFSSKARSPYTQLLLTHIDADGNDSPPILVENTTAANRAVNIPEFVNIPESGLEKIDPEATEFYRLFNQAFELMESKRIPEAVPLLQQAVLRDPDDPLAHYGLATAYSATGREREAVGEYKKACDLNPRNGAWLAHLAVSLALTGDFEEAIANWRKSLALDPKNAGVEADLGTALFETGRPDEGYAHLRKAIELAPDFPDAHSHLGWELGRIGKWEMAIEELKKAIELRPDSVEFRANLAYVLEQSGDLAGAVSSYEKAVDLSGNKDMRCLDMLARAYAKLGLAMQAVRAEQQALELAIAAGNQQVADTLRRNLERYRQAATGQ